MRLPLGQLGYGLSTFERVVKRELALQELHGSIRQAILSVVSGIEGLQFGELLGSGGFADVYEAEETQLGRRVAVKVFRTRVDGMDRKSFEREGQAMGRLSGVRNVVHVYRSGVTGDGHPFLVMEQMQYPLSALVGSGELSIDHVLHTGVVIGRALAVAHESGILHRDLKPANILVDRYGEPALSDFGISTVMRSDESSSVYGFSAEHAAPELFEQSRATPAADVYSLGATLFTLIEGRPPFERQTNEGPLAFMTRVTTEDPPSCSRVADDHPELDALLIAAMAKDPGDRPTLQHLVDGLEALSGPDTGPSVDQLPAAIATPTSAGGDTVVGRGASTSPDRVEDPEPLNDDLGGPGDMPASGRRKVIAGAVGSLLAIALIAAWLLAIAGGDAEETAAGTDPTDEEASGAADGNGEDDEAAGNTEDTTPAELKFSGVANTRPQGGAGVPDTSGILRTRIDTFAAGTDAPAVSAASFENHKGGGELDFGTLPALIDYGATNKLGTSECYQLVLHDLDVVGAARSIWSNGTEFALLYAVELGSEGEAESYLWATELFTGVSAAGCDGWPDNGMLVDPASAELERSDFELGVDSDGGLTAILSDIEENSFSADIAYAAVVRQGHIVLVGMSGILQGQGDPAVHISLLQEMVGAFAT